MSDAEHALIQEKLIKEKIDELLRLLSSEDIFTSDDFLQRVADMQAQISVGNHPEEAGRRITATADRDFYSQALDAIKTQFTLYFERAEVIYSRLNIANRDQLAEEAARVGAVLNAQPNALNHQEESFAVLTAIRRYESEFLQQEQEEVESENRWFLGFWNDYKNFATKRSETDFNESQFFSQTTLELQRKGWQGLDEELLRDLFDQTVEIEELIEVARNTFADLTLEDFESIEESLEELHNSTQPTETGIAETQVLYNRLLMKYQALKKAWLVNIDASFIEGAKKQGLRPKQLEKYEDYLDSLEALENNLRTLVTNDARAQSPGSINVDKKKHLSELYETVIENNRLLNVFQSKIPEQDLLRLNELYDRITSEAEILLGVQLDELESIFTDDVEWWLFAYHGEQWRRTQRLWQQYQAGNVEALILFDKLTIEELISYFSAEIQDLDENDVAYNQRFIALDIQLNRLQKMHSAMKEATDKKAADATPATAEGLGELDSDDKVLSWGDYDLDKSVGQWTIEECASFLTNSRQLAKEQKGQGSSIYSQFEKLRGQLERKEDQQFWTVFSAMYDIAIAYESSADDYSINQGKFFAEDIQAGTKRVERATFMRGLTYHPVFGDHVLNTHKVIKEILLGEEDDYGSIAATNGSLCASKLNVSKVEDVFPNKVREKFEAEYGIKVGSEEYPEHAFQAAYLYGKVFDFRHTAYLEAAKRAVTRNFGGEDPSWYDNPYAVLSYYLVRYAMIPDSKALLLLLVNVEESAQDERDKDLPLPADWIRGDEDEGRPRKVERIQEITDLIKEFYDIYIDVEFLLEAFRDSGFKLQDAGSIFPTLSKIMEPIPEGYQNSTNQYEMKDGEILFHNINDINMYNIARSGWKDVMDAVTGPIKPMEGEEIVRKINDFNRATGRAKMFRSTKIITDADGKKIGEDFDSGSYMKMLEPLSLMYYVRMFQSLHPSTNAEFHKLRTEILDKLEAEGGAEGVPPNVRNYLFKYLNNKKYWPIFRVSNPDTIKKRKYLYKLNTVAKKLLNKMGAVEKFEVQFQNFTRSFREIHKMRPPFTSWGVEKDTKE